jgi:hypothetical protein
MFAADTLETAGLDANGVTTSARRIHCKQFVIGGKRADHASPLGDSVSMASIQEPFFTYPERGPTESFLLPGDSLGRLVREEALSIVKRVQRLIAKSDSCKPTIRFARFPKQCDTRSVNGTKPGTEGRKRNPRRKA